MDEENIEKLKESVFSKQMVLAEIYKQNQGQSLNAYVNSWEIKPSKIEDVFLKSLEKLLQKIYGKQIAEEVVLQFQNEPIVSTIDHHGILNHPFFINSNLIFSLRRNLKYLICFSTNGVSLNNSSWPGCFLYNQDGVLHKISFFKDEDKTKTVYAAENISQERIKEVFSRVKSSEITNLLEDTFKNEVFSFPNFSDQASFLSFKLWQKFFPKAPKVIYLPLEDLVGDLAIDIYKNKNSTLYNLFFTERSWELVEKYFKETKGAFSSSGKGSFLFWGVDEHGRRVRLTKEDFSKKLGVEIVEQIKNRKMYPTSLVCFLVLLYYEVTCIGGFNQVNWLTEIKEKFLLLLSELGDHALAKKIQDVPTENFAEGNLAFLYEGEKFVKATGVDLYLKKDKNLYEKYQKLADVFTVGESIESLLPEIYKVITKGDERDRSLLTISDEDIVNKGTMGDKIKRLTSS